MQTSPYKYWVKFKVSFPNVYSISYHMVSSRYILHKCFYLNISSKTIYYPYFINDEIDIFNKLSKDRMVLSNYQFF